MKPGLRFPVETLCRVAAMVFLLLLTESMMASAIDVKNITKQKPSPAATSMESYLERVRTLNSAQPTQGSIWNDSGRLTRMMTDVRAMRPHDLISVVVAENLAASTDGTVKNSRASNAS